eukprot:NODE_52_length_30984_cov_1.383358.p5 type:complete len:465 gc:universal NODE_52_length_30984_cov_1.383358:11409-12803(+)
MLSQLDRIELYKPGKDWYKLCSQFGQFHGSVFICQNCSCQYANVKRTVINHLLKHCLRGEQQKFLVMELVKIGDTSKYVNDWFEKLQRGELKKFQINLNEVEWPAIKPAIPAIPINRMQRLDSKFDLSGETNFESRLSKINTNLSYSIPRQEETPTCDNIPSQKSTESEVDDQNEMQQENQPEEDDEDQLMTPKPSPELDQVKKIKSNKTMGPRNQPPAWKIVSTQYGSFTPMNQTEKKTSRRRFWYTCTACQARMTENKTGITNHLLKSCLSIDTETKRKILDLLLSFGEDAPYILKMKSINNDKVHNAGRSARRGSRQSSAGILRGSQKRDVKSPFGDQMQRKVNHSIFKTDFSRHPTYFPKWQENLMDHQTLNALEHFPQFQNLPKPMSCDSSFKDDSSFLALSSFAELLSNKLQESSIEPDLNAVKAELIERKHILDSQFKNLNKLERLSKVSNLMLEFA